MTTKHEDTSAPIRTSRGEGWRAQCAKCGKLDKPVYGADAEARARRMATVHAEAVRVEWEAHMAVYELRQAEPEGHGDGFLLRRKRNAFAAALADLVEDHVIRESGFGLYDALEDIYDVLGKLPDPIGEGPVTVPA